MSTNVASNDLATESQGDRGSEASSRLAPFAGFADIARSNCRQMKALVAQLPPEPPRGGDEAWPDEAHLIWNHETSPIFHSIDEHAAIAIIFACAATELYINDAGARLLGDTYFRVHVERIDLLSKWVLVPRLASNHQMDRGGRAYELLHGVIGLRNDLMHPKSRPLTDALIDAWPETMKDSISSGPQAMRSTCLRRFWKKLTSSITTVFRTYIYEQRRVYGAVAVLKSATCYGSRAPLQPQHHEPSTTRTDSHSSRSEGGSRVGADYAALVCKLLSPAPLG